ncbi:RNI-like protein [Lichtheimia hyalospora FSU 10163]|nr:RNI-like protein [Lichtheimia hyalospora FSU 10163]
MTPPSTAAAAAERTTAALSAQLDRLNASISTHIERIQEAANCEDRNNVIAASSQLLNQLREAQLETLDMRASLLADNAQCQLALNDASTMIRLASSHPLGYCRAAAIYSLYGRQRAAIEMCEQGLRAVPLSNHASLIDGKLVAEKQLAKHVDFISSLPFDLVSHVVSELLDGDELQYDHRYLVISQTWRQRFLQCTSLVFRLIHQCDHTILLRIHQQLLDDAPNVGKVAVSFYWEEPAPLLNVLRQGNFISLKELEITGKSKKEYHREIIHYYMIDDPHFFFDSLSHIANTLTRLTLETDTEGDVMIQDLLECCTNLDYLRYVGDCNHCISRNCQEWSTKYDITQLILQDLAGGEMDYDLLSAIITRCPALYHLELNGCSNVDILEDIKQHCQRLAYLSLNFDPERDMLERPYYIKNHGLQVLEMGIAHTEFYTKLGTFLATYQDSLSILSVHINCELDHVTAPLSDRLQMTQLHELNCIYLVSTVDKYIVPWIIRQAPHLRSVLLVAADPVDRAILDALAELDFLAKLELRDCAKVDVAGLRHFFERHGSLGTHSSLHELILCILGCDLESDHAIDLLGRMCTLTNLVLFSVRGITMDGFERFAGQLRTWKQLQTLRFNNMDCISDHALEIMGHLPSLETLHLSFLNSVTNGGIVQLAGSPSLRHLCVAHCANVDADVVELVSHCLETKKRNTTV